MSGCFQWWRQKQAGSFPNLVEGAFERAMSPRDRQVSRAGVPEHLLRCIFWLLAARILQDKGVPNFKSIDLEDVNGTLQRLAKHYNAPHPLISAGGLEERLRAISGDIARMGYLGVVTTETLAQVYETALVTKTTRSAHGTHSTPGYLIEQIVSSLAPWIEELDEDRRHVFEPACGHAGFLVSATRLLRDLAVDAQGSGMKSYLRSHIHGIDVDDFALEVARLSLTLADVPNPNGWDLRKANVFDAEPMRSLASKAAVVLSNPPYERLRPKEAHTKAEEVARVVTKALRPGSMFGLVLPRNVLRSKAFADVREEWVRNCELKEVTLLPDKVFEYSDAEVAIVLGRKREPPKQPALLYRRVREQEYEVFKFSGQVRSRQVVSQKRFDNPGFELGLPELHEVWSRPWRTLEEIVTAGQGFTHVGKKEGSAPNVSDRPREGYVAGFAKFEGGEMLHGLPPLKFLNLKPERIARPRSGLSVGVPQLLVNYHPVSRGPWRLKAMIDPVGRPASSSFILVRPRSEDMPLEFLWALLNSPVANAYVSTHFGKRDILVEPFRQLPIPAYDSGKAAGVVRLVREYFSAARDAGTKSAQARAKLALLRVDAAVLRLYALRPRVERELLDTFSGPRRPGVPFDQTEYFPPEFKPCLPLSDYLELDERSTGAYLARTPAFPPDSLMVRALRAAEALAHEDTEDEE